VFKCSTTLRANDKPLAPILSFVFVRKAIAMGLIAWSPSLWQIIILQFILRPKTARDLS
jgi:hypothetical protein